MSQLATLEPRRARGSGGARLSSVSVVILAVALVSTGQALQVFWRDVPRRDFGAFYFSGAAWNAGGNIYAAGRADLPNLNPPGLTATVFAPLARLPLHTAALLWQVLGALALAFSGWRIARTLAIPLNAAALAMGIGLLTAGARYVWFEGQITWLLLVPATEGWLAYRAGARAAAGAWLGGIVAIKPFFAIAAVILGPAAAIAAAAVSLGLTALSILVTPLSAWSEWLALGPQVSVSWPLSGSLWTLAARVTGAAPLEPVYWTALGASITAIIACALLLLSILAWRLRDADARWPAALIVALLASPLGWLYYLPLTAGPLVAMWLDGRWSRWLTAGVASCCLPMQLHFAAIELGPFTAVSLGALYTWALLSIILGLDRAQAIEGRTGLRDPGMPRADAQSAQHRLL